MTEILERLRGSSEPEVRLVLPRRSMLADTAFNFQLLALQAERWGLRLVVESEDERALALAADAGLKGSVCCATSAVVPPAPRPSAGSIETCHEVEEYADCVACSGAEAGGVEHSPLSAERLADAHQHLARAVPTRTACR